MTFEEEYQDAINLMSKNIKKDVTLHKPLIPHLLRVGKYLNENSYSEEVVTAGLLHDLIEWTDNPEQLIKERFGKHVFDIVLANTKNREIDDPAKRREDYVNRCAEVGIDALIVKSADTLDSYQHYQTIGNEKEMNRSRHIAQLILEKVNVEDDSIFEKLKVLK